MLIRSVRLTDVHTLRRQQSVEVLNTPDALIHGFSPIRFGLRSLLPRIWSGRETLVLEYRGRPVACCYSASRRGAEHRLIVALSRCADRGLGDDVAWEWLARGICQHAAREGSLRVLARARDGSECVAALRRAGFTTYGQEVVYVRSYTRGAGALHPGLRPMSSRDHWDAWRLYHQTEPAPAQRAEGLTPSAWMRARKGRDDGAWVLRAGDGVDLLAELAFGERGAVLRVHYRPPARPELAPAIEHALALSARRGPGTLYCVAQENQAELAGLLEERGFARLQCNLRLVHYNATLAAWQEHPAIEPATSIARTGLTHLSASWSNTSKGDTDQPGN